MSEIVYANIRATSAEEDCVNRRDYPVKLVYMLKGTGKPETCYYCNGSEALEAKERLTADPAHFNG